MNNKIQNPLNKQNSGINSMNKLNTTNQPQNELNQPKKINETDLRSIEYKGFPFLPENKK